MFQQSMDIAFPELSEPSKSLLKLKPSLFNEGVFETKVGKNQRLCRKLMRVRVYRNLNRPEYFSILAMEGKDKGKVIGYAKSVLLENCIFKVLTGSRNRAVKDGVRNVHAFCQGVICDASNVVQDLPDNTVAVTYNPFRSGCFYYRDSGSSKTEGCKQALLQGSDVHITESA